MDPSHTKESLLAYLLGLLPAAEEAVVDRHLAKCQLCQTALRRTKEALAEVSLGLPRAAPPPWLCASLRSSTHELHRFGHVGAMLCVALGDLAPRAESICREIDNPNGWWQTRVPSLRIMPLSAQHSLWRVRPGRPIRRFAAQQQNAALLLQGRCRNPVGHCIEAGDWFNLRAPSGQYVVCSGADALYLVGEAAPLRLLVKRPQRERANIPQSAPKRL